MKVVDETTLSETTASPNMKDIKKVKFYRFRWQFYSQSDQPEPILTSSEQKSLDSSSYNRGDNKVERLVTMRTCSTNTLNYWLDPTGYFQHVLQAADKCQQYQKE